MKLNQKNTVCDQKSTLFRFQKIISHFKNKFSQIFEHGKTCYRRNSPQNYCADASKVLLSSHLQAAKFENPSTPWTIWDSFVANGTVLPKPKSGRLKKLSKRDERFQLRKVQKDWFLSIQKLQTEFNSFSPDKTVSHCTLRRVLARNAFLPPHWWSSSQETDAKGQSKARKIEMVQTDKTAWSRLLEAVCVFKLVQIQVTQRRSGWVRWSHNERRKPRCTLSSSKDPRLFFGGYHCLQWDSGPHQSTRKKQFVGLYPHFGRSWNSFFPGIGKQVGWRQCSNSSLPCRKWMENQRKVRIWTLLKCLSFAQLRCMKREFADFEGAVCDI